MIIIITTTDHMKKAHTVKLSNQYEVIKLRLYFFMMIIIGRYKCIIK